MKEITLKNFQQDVNSNLAEFIRNNKPAFFDKIKVRVQHSNLLVDPFIIPTVIIKEAIGYQNFEGYKVGKAGLRYFAIIRRSLQFWVTKNNIAKLDRFTDHYFDIFTDSYIYMDLVNVGLHLSSNRPFVNYGLAPFIEDNTRLGKSLDFFAEFRGMK